MDSSMLTMELGLMVIAAAKLAKNGKGLQEVTAEVNWAMPATHMPGLLDTLRYLVFGWAYR
jgi:fatty acid-binding protein DegV